MRVLIVDDDTDLAAVISAVFSRNACEVEVATDGEQALQTALNRRPDVVLSDVLMPRMDGWSLVRQMRSHPQLSLVPFVFLTELSSQAERMLGYTLGADDYVPKPFEMHELLLRVQRVVRKGNALATEVRSWAPQAAKPQDGFSGSLAVMGLPTILGLLDIEKPSGQLVVTSGTDTGVMMIRHGQPCAARLEKSGRDNEQAIFEMVRWRSGQFRFSVTPEPPDGPITASTTELLLRGAQLEDEFV